MSAFIERHVPLKDLRSCHIRPLREADSASMLILERAIVLAKEGVVKYEDELPDEATYAAQIKINTEAIGALHLVAESSGALLGEASLRRFSLRMLRHVGFLTLGVHPEAQGQGLGRALFGCLLEWARGYQGPEGERLLRLELYTRADNARAIKLYQSLGFEIEGTRRGFIRQADGSMLDDYVMGLLWSDTFAPSLSR